MVTSNNLTSAELLRDQYLFKGLNEEEIAHVVARVHVESFSEGERIIEQGSPGNSFYVISQGSVQVSRYQRGQERQLDVLSKGDYFGEEALLFDRPRSASVTAREPVQVLRLDRDVFFELLQRFPQIRMNLSATAESRHLAQKMNFDWLEETETIYLVARKHDFFLWLSLVFPMVLGLGSIVLASYGIAWAGDFRITLAGGASLIVALGLGGWFWLDWSNDFYIVTSHRVVWLEKIVLLYSSRRESPLTQVLSVNVKRSWLARLIGYGDVDVRTFTGGVKMRRADQPELFVKYVEQFRARAQERIKEAEARAMERAVRERLGLPIDEDEIDKVQYGHTPRVQRRTSAKPGSLREKIETFLQVRYEQGGVITYRKHWLLLLRRVWIPTLFLSGILLFIYYLVSSWSAGGSIPFGGLLAILLTIVIIVLLGWWIYNYLDWSNDIYQVAPEQIRDIERRPLGDEQKLTAPLESIQTIEHSRDGIIQLIFNYGNVIINAGQTNFVFRGVFNPDQVHQDISDYMGALERRKREAEARRERARMADWFETYHHQASILDEYERGEDADRIAGKI